MIEIQVVVEYDNKENTNDVYLSIDGGKKEFVCYAYRDGEDVDLNHISEQVWRDLRNRVIDEVCECIDTSRCRFEKLKYRGD